MPFVLVKNNIVIKTLNGFRALTADELSNGGQRLEVDSGVPIYIGGTATVTGGKVSTITDPNALTTVQSRRLQIQNWLRFMDNQPAANWALHGAVSGRRASNYWKWLESIAAASSIDGNLSNNTKWAVLEAEMTWSAAGWYKDHNEAGWTPLTLAVLTTTLFYKTAANGNQVADNSIALPSSWGGLVPYIYE